MRVQSKWLLFVLLGAFPVMVLLTNAGSSYGSPSYLVTQWGGQIDEEGFFDDPSAIAINSSGHVYLVNHQSGQTLVFTKTGKYLFNINRALMPDCVRALAVNTADVLHVLSRDWVEEFLPNNQAYTTWSARSVGFNSGCVDIAINASGYVYVANYNNRSVNIYTPSGNFLRNLTSTGSESGQISYPVNVAINSSGYVYVIDWTMRMQVFSPSGQYLFNWTSGLGIDSSDLAINGTGEVFIAGGDTAWIYSATGQLIKQMPYGAGDGQFLHARAIAINSTGHVYITDGISHRVQVFAPNGDFLFKWYSSGTANGRFIHPSGIVINSTGHMYVTDSGNQRVQVFGPNGEFLFKWGNLSYPFGITVNSSGDVYVVNGDEVKVFSQTGSFLYKWGGSGTSIGLFDDPYGIAIGGNDLVYVMDTGNSRVQVFSPSGQFVGYWGSNGTGDGQFLLSQYALYPNDIAVDNAGNVYVGDNGNDRVQVFNASGQFLSKWEGIENPRGIAITADGRIYVSSKGYNAIYSSGHGTYYNHLQEYSAGGQRLSDWDLNVDDWTFCEVEIENFLDLAVNATGYLFVVNTMGHQIAIFSEPPDWLLIGIIVNVIVVAAAVGVWMWWRWRQGQATPKPASSTDPESTPEESPETTRDGFRVA